MVARVRTMSRASWRTTRSAYRCRTRVSSERSLCRVGRGRSALLAISQDVASTDSSPRRLEMTRPSTTTWSPMSTSAFQSASDSSPTSARLTITCSRVPMPSWRVAKQSLPVLRTNTTRPGDADDVVGLLAGLQVAPLLADLLEGMRAAHLDGVRVTSAVEQPLPLLAAYPHLLRDVVDRRFEGLAGHRPSMAEPPCPPSNRPQYQFRPVVDRRNWVVPRVGSGKAWVSRRGPARGRGSARSGSGRRR